MIFSGPLQSNTPGPQKPLSHGPIYVVISWIYCRCLQLGVKMPLIALCFRHTENNQSMSKSLKYPASRLKCSSDEKHLTVTPYFHKVKIWLLIRYTMVSISWVSNPLVPSFAPALIFLEHIKSILLWRRPFVVSMQTQCCADAAPVKEPSLCVFVLPMPDKWAVPLVECLAVHHKSPVLCHNGRKWDLTQSTVFVIKNPF